MPRFDNPCVGYVYTGQFLLRAKVVKDRIVSANGLTPIDGEVALFPWYTYRRVENAVARLEKQHGHNKGDVYLNIVPYTAELAAELKKDSLAKARLTRDHILHMLTAGKGLETPEQIAPYEQKADQILERMQKAAEKAAAA